MAPKRENEIDMFKRSIIIVGLGGILSFSVWLHHTISAMQVDIGQIQVKIAQIPDIVKKLDRVHEWQLRNGVQKSFNEFGTNANE